MWSDRYNYYSIQSDEQFSERIALHTVVEALLDTGLFKQTAHQTFINANHFSWVELVLVDTQGGNFHTSSKVDKWITSIAIVCLKGRDIDQKEYTDLFLHIAAALRWKLYLEEDDAGNENIQIIGE